MPSANDRAVPPRVSDHAAPLASLRLPRDVESDPRHDEIRRVLAANPRRIWAGGALDVAVVPLTTALGMALSGPAIRGALLRGLESAEEALASEQRGLAALPSAVAAQQGKRVSRVLVATNDGAERFYRQVERLAITHTPRVLVCLLDVPSTELGVLLYGPGVFAKLVMTSRKDAATRLLLALGSETAG